MLNFLKNKLQPTQGIGIVLLAVTLTACQSVPSESEPVPEIVSIPAEKQDEVPAETTKVDPTNEINQLNYKAALEDLKLGQTDAAIEELEHLGINAPGLDFVFTNLGLAYFKVKQYEPAEKAFERAISLNKNDAVAYNHLGIIGRIHGAFEKARQHYEKAISIDDKYASAHLNLGILFDIYLQDLNQALARYQKFQSLTNNEDKTVAGWIVDIKRRLKSG